MNRACTDSCDTPNNMNDAFLFSHDLAAEPAAQVSTAVPKYPPASKSTSGVRSNLHKDLQAVKKEDARLSADLDDKSMKDPFSGLRLL